MENNKKVYCKKCYWMGRAPKNYGKDCGHPSNLKEKDTPLEKVIVMQSSYYFINTKNDCANYR